jgi:hypothetical protein
MRTTKLGFEIETCTRCGGSGHYSFCEMYGTKCFKCHSAGVVMTKRGAAANAYYWSLFTVRVDSLKVGDYILDRGMTTKKRKVLGIKPVSYDMCHILADGTRVPILKLELSGITHYTSTDAEVTKCDTPDECSRKLTLALEYQATLTKMGKPRKTKNRA